MLMVLFCRYLAGPAFSLADVFAGATLLMDPFLDLLARMWLRPHKRCMQCGSCASVLCTCMLHGLKTAATERVCKDVPAWCAAPMLLSAQRYGAHYKTFPKIAQYLEFISKRPSIESSWPPHWKVRMPCLQFCSAQTLAGTRHLRLQCPEIRWCLGPLRAFRMLLDVPLAGCCRTRLGRQRTQPCERRHTVGIQHGTARADNAAVGSAESGRMRIGQLGTAGQTVPVG